LQREQRRGCCGAPLIRMPDSGSARLRRRFPYRRWKSRSDSRGSAWPFRSGCRGEPRQARFLLAAQRPLGAPHASGNMPTNRLSDSASNDLIRRTDEIGNFHSGNPARRRGEPVPTIGRFVLFCGHGDSWQLFMNPSAIRGCRCSHDERCFHSRGRRGCRPGYRHQRQKASTHVRIAQKPRSASCGCGRDPGREIRGSNASTHIQLLAWVYKHGGYFVCLPLGNAEGSGYRKPVPSP
jgi:hypothetical protein